ncbi:MAG: hypothetical protein HGB11_09395 [Chlorobiales bacterium]|nr:hypothetical protein [Chlorobiales bacterium]
MMQYIFALLCMCFLLSCASSQPQGGNLEKCDAPLRKSLEALKQGDESDTIEIIGKCKSSITNEQLQKLCDTGAAIGTVAGDIFTASAPATSIHQLAALEFITRLELSRKTRPLQH